MFIALKYCQYEYGFPAINNFGGTLGHWFPYDESQHNYNTTKNHLLHRRFRLVMTCHTIFYLKSVKSSKAYFLKKYVKEITRNLNIKSFCIKDTEIRVKIESYLTSGKA